MKPTSLASYNLSFIRKPPMVKANLSPSTRMKPNISRENLSVPSSANFERDENSVSATLVLARNTCSYQLGTTIELHSSSDITVASLQTNLRDL